MIDGTSVVLLIPSAADELGAGRNGLLDPGRDPIGLAREDKRADLGFGQEGIADPQCLHTRGEAVEKRALKIRMDIDPLNGHARLSGMIVATLSSVARLSDRGRHCGR